MVSFLYKVQKYNTEFISSLFVFWIKKKISKINLHSIETNSIEFLLDIALIWSNHFYPLCAEFSRRFIQSKKSKLIDKKETCFEFIIIRMYMWVIKLFKSRWLRKCVCENTWSSLNRFSIWYISFLNIDNWDIVSHATWIFLM